MSEGPSDHLPDQPDFVSAADSADPLRDPTHPDPGDPDPFDAAAFEPDDRDPLAEDPLAADKTWDDPTWDDPTWGDGSEGEPHSALEPHAPDDGLPEDDVPDADVHARTDADSGADGGEGDGTEPSASGPDDGWTGGDDELDLPVDPDAALELDPLAEHGRRAVEETTQLVIDALVVSTDQDQPDTGAPVPGWDGVAIGVEPAVSAWAVPVVDPDPDFVDLDLLG